jgi:hypothetical protein
MEVGRSAIIDYWRGVLGAFDWPGYRLDALIGLWERDFEDEASMFWHESLAYYVAYELMTELADLPDRPGVDPRVPAAPWEPPGGVQRIIEGRVKWDPARRTFTADWEQLRSEILGFLGRYGKTIAVRLPEW